MEFSKGVGQLGIMRFGTQLRVVDTFSGNGSTPFEAAKVDCDAYASDPNPIACMLTWGSFNIVGAEEKLKKETDKEQNTIAADVDRYIAELDVERDRNGNRVKAYL